MSYCQDIIEDIRKNEYGVLDDNNNSETELSIKSKKRLGRALEKLAMELYSKDVHFVLELI